MKTSNKAFISMIVIMFLVVLAVSFYYRTIGVSKSFTNNDYQKLNSNNISGRPIILPSFSSVGVYGNFNLKINQNNQIKPSIFVSEVNHKQLTISIKQGMLHLNKEQSLFTASTAPVEAILSTNLLNGISIFGNSIINVTNIVTPLLRFNLNGNSNAHLEGDIKNIQLNLNGHSALWVNLKNEESINLTTHGNSKVHFAGEVKNITIKVVGNTFVDAKNLTAGTVTIIAEGNNKIVVNAKNTLNANLVGKNVVQYYGKPSVNENSNPSSIISPME